MPAVFPRLTPSPYIATAKAWKNASLVPGVSFPLTVHLIASSSGSPEHRFINEYLSDPERQIALGVDSAVRGNFTFSSPTVAQAFAESGDIYTFPAKDYLAALLERGVRALIFVGDADWICNYVRAKLGCAPTLTDEC